MFKSVLKVTMALIGFGVLAQAIPAYYWSNEFRYFLENQTKRSISESQLKRSLLEKAREFSLPVTEDNIDISTLGRTYRVAVNYTVPIDLLVYSHPMEFHSKSGGWLPK